VEELLDRVIRELKTTVVMATHDMAQGQRLATRIAVMVGGELMQTGTPYEVFNAPKNQAIANFVGVENVFQGTVVSTEGGILGVDIGNGTIYACGNHEVEDKVQAFVRPEAVVLALEPTSTSARNGFKGRVTHVVRQGPLAHVTLDCGFTLKALITTRSAEDMDISEGRQMYAFFKVTGIHVVPLSS